MSKPKITRDELIEMEVSMDRIGDEIREAEQKARTLRNYATPLNEGFMKLIELWESENGCRYSSNSNVQKRNREKAKENKDE